jgi:hypothetical protein
MEKIVHKHIPEFPPEAREILSEPPTTTSKESSGW